MTETDDQRLRRLGVTDEDRDAFATFETIWHNFAVRPLLSDTAIGMRDLGQTALDTLDIHQHDLHPADATALLRRGFTPHQASLLTHHEQAQLNYYTPDDTYDEFIETSLPSDVLTELLVVATSQDEARQFIATLTEPSDDNGASQPSEAEIKVYTTISTRAARANINGSTCNCPIRRP